MNISNLELPEAQHTPGPWKVRAATFCEDGVPSYEVVMPGKPQMNAVDARLIAAAPDLLAALRFYMMMCGNTCYAVSPETAKEMHAMGKAAVDKVEGKADRT